MIKGFDRKLEYHPLAVFAGFTYWLLSDYYTNWMEPPPGVSYRMWFASLGEMLGNYLDIRVAARGLFLSIALQLCDELQSTVTGIYPTLEDVLNFAKKRKKHPMISHLARYCETLTNRIEGLLNIFGDHICSRRRLDWNAYVSSDWAISLDGTPTDYQNLFMTVDIGKLLMYRIANNMRSDQLEILIVFDEASTIFKKWYEDREGTYLLSDYLAKSREFGVGFIIGTQSLSGLADSVLANTGTKILVGGAGAGTDYNIFASATGATLEQREFLKQLTQPGIACCKDPRYPHPFTIKVPRIA
jgi:hypothetical protein